MPASTEPSGRMPMRSCLLLHAWWGLNDDVLRAAERLRLRGFSVRAPDLYGNGRVARSMQEAKDLLANRDLDAARARVDAAIEDLGTPDRLGVVGWSMGAAFGWDLIERRPECASALVAYYGLGDPDALAKIPPTLAHVAEMDDSPSPRDADNVATSFRSKGNTFELAIYPGTRHWFDEPSRPEFDPPASRRAWRRTVSFLEATLGPGGTR